MAVVRGVELALHPSPDYVSDVIRETGDFYEAAILDELTRRVAGGVLVDVGAMIGNHTTFFARFLPHTAIHAFEPIAANRRVLRANVAPFPTVTVHPVALSSKAGTVLMSAPAGNLGHASIGAGRPVKAMTLDSFAFQDVNLLKIDVEGHEPEVLAGARDTIARCRPLILIEDWSGPPTIPGYRLVAEWETAHQTFLMVCESPP